MMEDDNCIFIIKSKCAKSIFESHNEDRRCSLKSRIEGFCTVHYKIVSKDFVYCDCGNRVKDRSLEFCSECNDKK